MTGFLAELGRKLAERWFTLLVLPGLAYLLVAAVAVRLGQRGWHDWRALWDGFTALTEGEAGGQDSLVARAVLLVLAAVPVSAAVGALAQALAGPVERVLCGPWPRPLSGLSARLTTRRQTFWATADTAHRRQSALAEAAHRRQAALALAARRAGTRAARTTGPDAGPGTTARAAGSGTPEPAAGSGTTPPAAGSVPPDASPSPDRAGVRTARHLAARSDRYAAIAAHHDQGAADHAARRNAHSLIRPEHPTRLGDRLRAPAVRLGQEYGVDLAVIWPRLWLLLPTPTRETLTATRSRLDAAFALGGWALLYLPLALRWWPAALIALVTALISRRRAELAAEAYAELVEATVDLHLDRLHTRLAEPRPTPQQGRALTERLRRGL